MKPAVLMEKRKTIGTVARALSGIKDIWRLTMYRTAEQIHNAIAGYFVNHGINPDCYTSLRDGDELTGLQILAQLSVEEQERFASKCPCDFDIQIHLQDKLTQNCYANGIGPKWENCTACWVHCLERIYVYRNGKFEPKE